MRSGNRVRRSSPGQTTMRSAVEACRRSSRRAGGSTDLTSVRRKNVDAVAPSSQAASVGMAWRLSTRTSCGLHKRAREGAVGEDIAVARAAPRPRRAACSPRPCRCAANASSTAIASGRLRRDEQALVLDRDAGLRRDLDPDVARPHRPAPAFAGLLAGDGDEAEIADRGADARLAVDHGHPSRAGRGQRMGEADDASAHHHEIEASPAMIFSRLPEPPAV